MAALKRRSPLRKSDIFVTYRLRHMYDMARGTRTHAGVNPFSLQPSACRRVPRESGTSQQREVGQGIAD